MPSFAHTNIECIEIHSKITLGRMNANNNNDYCNYNRFKISQLPLHTFSFTDLDYQFDLNST